MQFSNNRNNPFAKPPGSIVAGLDIGSSKVCCFIARISNTNRLNVIGIGHYEARGIKNGNIVDMELAEISVGHAVQLAEQMAGQTIDSVVVNVSGIHAHSHTTTSKVSVTGSEVNESDVRKSLIQSRECEVSGQNELIHTIPVSYAMDNIKGISNPLGMIGKQLSTTIHGVTAASNALKNLRTCIANNHLEIEAFCAAPYASALSCLVEDEIDLGCTLIDMGAGTTSIAVFLEGKLVYVDAIAVGGSHVTSDIARGLTTPLNHAERLKTLYGSAIQSPRDEMETIEVPQTGEEDRFAPNYMPRSLLTGIIQPRLEETFEMVRARLDASGYINVVGRRVVLTGGASQLQGLTELGTLILNKQIRIASPIKISGLAEATSGPAFSCASGLLHYSANRMNEVPNIIIPVMTPGNFVSRLGSWLKENW